MTEHSDSKRGKFVKQAFSFFTRFTSSASVATINLDPVNSTTFFGTSVSNMANLYQEFRLVGLRVHMYPNPTASAASNQSTALVIGHANQSSATAPTSVADISALSDCAVLTSGMTVPAVFKLGKKGLLANTVMKWFHVDVTPNTVTDMQGRIYYAATGTDSGTWVQNWLVHSVWEFRSPVPFGLFLDRARDQKSPVDVITPLAATVFSPPELALLSKLVQAAKKPSDDGTSKAAPAFPPGVT